METIEILLNISDIILDSTTHIEAMHSIVSLLKKSLKSDVCSIYLLDKHNKDLLTLTATEGLHKDAINKVKMHTGEGLTGATFNNNDYLFIRNVIKNPLFKYFPGIGEEPFNTFIGMPLKDRTHSFGVLVFQFKKNKINTLKTRKLLIAVAAQVSSLVLKYYILENTQITEQTKSNEEITIKGIPLSEGIAIGKPVHIIYNFIESTSHIDREDELKKLQSAIYKTKDDITNLIIQIELDDKIKADIFYTHLMILEDSSFIKNIETHISKHNKTAASGIRYVSDIYINRFLSFEDFYLKERASDMDDICQRLLSNLGAISKKVTLSKNSIIIAEKLTPGETASLNLEKVTGFVTESDGITSHTAILAKSRRIPAITGIKDIMSMAAFCKRIILDGYEGLLILNPKRSTLKKYFSKLKSQIYEKYDEPCYRVILKNGTKIHFLANVASVLDAEKSKQFCADGIGLIRSEIFYLQNGEPFDEKLNADFYNQLIRSSPDGPITLRLLDIGADKKTRKDIKEMNPALGLRGARYILAKQDLLKKQINAILNIKDKANLKLLIPFVTNVDEFIVIKKIIVDSFVKNGYDVPPVGAMIEIPSIIFTLDKLLLHADFFSIGTNDLFQYIYAVDRTNPSVSSLYSPDTQSFYSILELVYEKLAPSGKDIGICGEITADKNILKNLIQIGFNKFSVNPYVIKTLRQFLIAENI